MPQTNPRRQNPGHPNFWIHILEKVKGPARIYVLAGLAVFLVSSLFLVNYRSYAVVIDSNEAVLAASKQEANKVLAQLAEQKSQGTGLEVNLNPDLKFVGVWDFHRQALAGDELKGQLAKFSIFQSNGVGISVEGQVIAVLIDESAAQKVLTVLKERYAMNEDTRVSFAEKVKLVEVVAPESDLLGFEDALEYICTGGEEVQTYTLREGDNLWDLAVKAGISMEELEVANPGVKNDRLQIGQVINTSMNSPLINVVASYESMVTEDIPYRVQEKQDNSLYKGERKVVDPGRPGEKEVIYRVIYRNGLEVDREVVAEKVTREAEPRVVAQGNRMLVASRSSSGSGLLAWPAAGGIVSPYGPRGGRMHTGIDIAGNHGAPVVASEAGRVISAAYQGGYGLMVEINHGGGVVTRYAHLSSAAVKPGQQVERGQLVGRVGSTGNSTGPHLHFEVIMNGQHRNPMTYL